VKKEILENFKYDKIISFIKTGTVHLMSVIVVGDIDVTVMEKRLKSISNKNPIKEKERKIFEVPNHSATSLPLKVIKRGLIPKFN
jgi:zinc protease